MAFEHLGRQDRKMMRRIAEREAAHRPKVLTPIPRDRWPVERLGVARPTEAWESRKYLAQLFDVEPFQGIDTRRLSVCRVTIKDDGHWEENLSWDELMDVKHEAGFADWYAMEIYPRERDVVNVANMRHLWLLASPLTIGWFAGAVPIRDARHE